MQLHAHVLQRKPLLLEGNHRSQGRKFKALADNRLLNPIMKNGRVRKRRKG